MGVTVYIVNIPAGCTLNGDGRGGTTFLNNNIVLFTAMIKTSKNEINNEHFEMYIKRNYK